MKLFSKQLLFISLGIAIFVAGGIVIYAVNNRGVAPVAYWKFDEGQGATAYDASGNANNGTITGVVWQNEENCKTGKCLYFDGVDDIVSAGSGASLDDLLTVTYEAWILPHTVGEASLGIIFDKSNGAANFTTISLVNTNTIKFTVDYATTDLARLSSNNTITLNQWNHIVITWDGSVTATNVHIYINGKETSYQTTTNAEGARNSDATYSQYIGNRAATDQTFNGNIDDAKIFNYVRTAMQIKSDFVGKTTKQGVSVRVASDAESRNASDGLVGYWEMDEASWNGTAGEVIDSSGNGNNGTSSNGANTTSTAKFGMAGSFDGTDDYVDVGSNSSLTFDNSDFTVSAWIKANGRINKRVIHRRQYSNGMGYGITIYGDAYNKNIIKFFVRDNNGAQVCVNSNKLDDDRWYFITGVFRRGSIISLYINGVLHDSDNASTITGNLGGNRDLYLGGISGASFFGLIDDVKIYNKARTAEQIRRDYESGPPPVAHWKMDENTGQTAFDTSGTNNGTLGTGATADSADPTWTNGKYGSGLKFDGVNDYVSVSGPLIADGNSWSVSIWGNAYSLSYSSLFGAGYGAWLPGDGRVFFTNAGSNHHVWYVADVLNQWRYYTFTHVGGTTAVTLYINGVSKGVSSNSGSLALNMNRIALSDDRSSWNGLLDDVRIYNYARTPKQIMEDMLGGPRGLTSSSGGQTSAAGYWNFDETQGTTAYDKSINDNDLILSVASWATSSCKFGGCYRGGANTRIIKTDDADFDFGATDDFSVSTWFKRSAMSSQEYLIHKQADFEGYAVYLDASGDVIFGIGDTSSTAFPEESIGNIGRDYDDGNWHLATAVKTSNSRIDLFVDGVLIASDTSLTTDATLENAGKLILGDSEETADSDGFLGNIDDTKIYRFALSPAEIKEEFNRGASLKLGSLGGQTSAAGGLTSPDAASLEYCVPGDATICAPPVARWKMDEKTGQYANDTSSNANTGTLGTGATADASDPIWKSSALCHTGSCLKFDGVNDYVNAGTGINPSTYSMSAWIYPTNAENNLDYAGQSIVHRTVGDGNYQLWVGVSANDLNVSAFNNANTIVKTTSNYIQNNQWYYISVVAVRGGELKAYINGNLVISTTNAGNDAGGSAVFAIGCLRAGLGWFFTGFIDDVRIYNYARTPAQIAWDYNRGAPIAHWKMNDGQDTATTCNGTGTTVKDSSGNGSTGTLTNSTSPAISWIDGKYNCAIDFDGDDDVVMVTQNSTINLTTKPSYAISAWVYPHTDGQGDNGEIIQKGTATYLKVAGESGGRVNVMGSLDLTTTGDATLTLTSAIPINAWSHIVMTYDDDSDDEISIYINGILKGTSTNGDGSPVTETNNLSIGGSTSYNFDGLIDDVRIYNYSPTPLQVKTLFNQGSAVRFGPLEGLP